MQKQVVDASAVLAVILGEKHRALILADSEDAELLAPGSLPWEIGNALVAGHRRERLTNEQVFEAMERYGDIVVRLEEVAREAALRLAINEGIYAYDAYMLTLCEHHVAPLLSVDLRLRRTARKRDIELLPAAIEGDERFQ